MNKKQKILTKTDMKSAAKIISFVLVLVVLLELFSLGSFSKLNALTYGNYFTKTYSFISEPENSIEVAGIGSSDLYSAFVPMQLFEKYGYTSTVISTPHQTTLQSYGFLKELLEKQNPKVLVIETDMLYEGAPEFKQGKVKKDRFAKQKARASNFFNALNAKRFDDLVESHFSIFTFHDKWKTFKFADLNKPKQSAEDVAFHHGYNFNDSVKAAKFNPNMSPTDIAEPVSDENLCYLNKMIKLCNKYGIKVVLVEMPTQNSWTYYRHNTVQALAEENHVDFIDFNLMFDEIGLDINCDYRDGGDHLNYFGASKTTSYLSDYISRNYGNILSDRRNDPSFAYWKESNEKFKSNYNIEKILKEHFEKYGH